MRFDRIYLNWKNYQDKETYYTYSGSIKKPTSIYHYDKQKYDI